MRYDTTPIAEGGFSFVYRARDATSGEHYALKKVLCQVKSAHVAFGVVSYDCYKLGRLREGGYHRRERLGVGVSRRVDESHG